MIIKYHFFPDLVLLYEELLATQYTSPFQKLQYPGFSLGYIDLFSQVVDPWCLIESYPDLERCHNLDENSSS